MHLQIQQIELTKMASSLLILAQDIPFLQQQPSFPPSQQEQQPSFPQQPSPCLITYENPQLGVRVLVPSDSQIIGESPESVNLASDSANLAISLGASLCPCGTLEDNKLSAQGGSSLALPGHSVVDVQDSVLSNNGAFSVLHSWPDQTYSVQTDTIYNNKYYSLQIGNLIPASDFNSLTPLIEQIQSSYQIIG